MKPGRGFVDVNLREGKALVSNRYARLRHTLNRKPDADGEHRGSTDAASCLAESTISRRSAIATIVAVAATGSLAEAGAVDPIFPVLETFRLAQEALFKAIKASADLPQEQWLTPHYVEAKSKLDGAYALFKKAQLDLLTTMPTTRAGVAALLVRLGQATHFQQPSVTNGDIEPGLLVEAMCWRDEPTRAAACTVLGRIAALVLKTV